MSLLVRLRTGVDAIWHPLTHDALAPADATGIVIAAVSVDTTVTGMGKYTALEVEAPGGVSNFAFGRAAILT